MNAAGPACARTTRSILVVLEGELELHQRGIDRPDRFYAMATEVVRVMLQMQPGGLERPDRRHDLRVWLLQSDPPCFPRRAGATPGMTCGCCSCAGRAGGLLGVPVV